jgi:2,3-dihydroxybenzoate decarboxylase
MSDERNGLSPKIKTIALEEHFSTPMQIEKSSASEYRSFYLSTRSDHVGHNIVDQLADLDEQRLAYMDAAGIDVQVLSFTSPGPQAFEAAEAIPLARDANDRLEQAVKRHPDRFAGFAALPTAAPDTAADELERTVTKCGFKGAMIDGHTRGSFLDDKKYWVIFERAEALGVPIYLHPAVPHPDALRAYFTGYEDLARAPWGFGIDTSTHFLRLVFAGVFDAFPNLKIILGHLGECLPFAMHRMNDHTVPAAKRRGLQKTPLQYLEDNLIVTTSGNWFIPAFVCAVEALGIDNVLFSVDWPFEPNSTAMEYLRKLPISELDREKVAHLNAERVLRIEPLGTRSGSASVGPVRASR